MQPTNWQKKFRKNWKTWLVSLFMALTLLGGGTATLGRLLRPAHQFASERSHSHGHEPEHDPSSD